MLVEHELDESESVEETMAAIHAWLVVVSREVRMVRRLAIYGLVLLTVGVAAAVVVAVVLVTEFGLS